MNHLLRQITWNQYLATALITAVIYYLFIILRCYRPELQKLMQRFSGNLGGEALQVLRYQDFETDAPPVPALQPLSAPENEARESISGTDILTGQLKACISKAADKPFAPEILIPQLKGILQEHQPMAASERPAINRLIVNECEKTGTALLTEEEADQWWES
jgi:hypothetical protein